MFCRVVHFPTVLKPGENLTQLKLMVHSIWSPVATTSRVESQRDVGSHRMWLHSAEILKRDLVCEHCLSHAKYIFHSHCWLFNAVFAISAARLTAGCSVYSHYITLQVFFFFFMPQTARLLFTGHKVASRGMHWGCVCVCVFEFRSSVT